MNQPAQEQMTQEMAALNVLMKAAEKYLATLDDVARGPTAQHLQSAISVIVRAIQPLDVAELPPPVEAVEAETESK